MTDIRTENYVFYWTSCQFWVHLSYLRIGIGIGNGIGIWIRITLSNSNETKRIYITSPWNIRAYGHLFYLIEKSLTFLSNIFSWVL